MLKRLFTSFIISGLLVSGVCLGDEAQISVTPIKSPLQVRLRVEAAGRSSYKFNGSVYNSGNEDIFDSTAELTVRNDSGYEATLIKSLKTLRSQGTKSFSWTVKGLPSGTYTATLVVRGYNADRTHRHEMGDSTTFAVGPSWSIIRRLFSRFLR